MGMWGGWKDQLVMLPSFDSRSCLESVLSSQAGKLKNISTEKVRYQPSRVCPLSFDFISIFDREACCKMFNNKMQSCALCRSLFLWEISSFLSANRDQGQFWHYINDTRYRMIPLPVVNMNHGRTTLCDWKEYDAIEYMLVFMSSSLRCFNVCIAH